MNYNLHKDISSEQYGIVEKIRYEDEQGKRIYEARVNIDGRLSGWMPVATVASVKHNFTITVPLQIGDQVVVSSVGKHRDGYVSANLSFKKAEVDEKACDDKVVITFKKGFITLDITNGDIEIDTGGTIKMKAEKFELDAPLIAKKGCIGC